MSIFLFADNQDITRIGLKYILQTSAYADEMYEAANKEDLQQLLRTFPEAVVILDYTQFDFSSPQQLLNVCASVPSSSWVLFSEELSPAFLRIVLQSDPSISIVMKHAPKQEILNALKNASVHIPYRCEEAMEILRQEMIHHSKPLLLTKSEKEILHEIALGKTTKEIAGEKNLSFHTVNSHRKNIFRKLEVNNVQEAIKFALRAGLIDASDYYI